MFQAESSSRSLLGPDMYHSSEQWNREQALVFERTWHFACLSGELAQPGDFVTLRVGRAEVIVRRGEAGIAAFRNVCSHRHCLILSAPAGRQPLRCGYHGWTYDDQGYPVGLPGCRDDFGLTPSDRRELSLDSVPVATVGPLVFVSIAEPAVSLMEYLGDFAEVFAGWGGAFSRPFEVGEQDWRANWKTGVENTLEPYHAPFVHADSLAQVLEPEYRIGSSGRHSSIFHRLREPSRKWWEAMTERGEIPSGARQQDYWHYLIYPNLCIGLTFGRLLSLQTFEPTTPDTCRLRYRLTLPGDCDAPPPLRDGLESYLAEFNRTVLLEDQAPVEACRRGCAQTTRHAVLAKSEKRIALFHSALLTDLR